MSAPNNNLNWKRAFHCKKYKFHHKFHHAGSKFLGNFFLKFFVAKNFLHRKMWLIFFTWCWFWIIQFQISMIFDNNKNEFFHSEINPLLPIGPFFISYARVFFKFFSCCFKYCYLFTPLPSLIFLLRNTVKILDSFSISK